MCLSAAGARSGVRGGKLCGAPLNMAEFSCCAAAAEMERRSCGSCTAAVAGGGGARVLRGGSGGGRALAVDDVACHAQSARGRGGQSKNALHAQTRPVHHVLSRSF